MDRLIVSLFGVNRTNLLGWVFTGVLVFALAAYLVLAALVPPVGFGLRPKIALLTASCLLLGGIFGVLLQLYCSLLAIRLDLNAKPPADR